MDGLENKVKRQSVDSNGLTDYEILKLRDIFEFKEIENRYEKLAKQFSYCRSYNIFSEMNSIRFYDYIIDIRGMLEEQ